MADPKDFQKDEEEISRVSKRIAKRSALLFKEAVKWFVFLIVVIALLIALPKLVGKIFESTFEGPFKAQEMAISKSNKTDDTASGVIGTSVNKIPFNLFQKVVKMNSQTDQSVDIEIPELVVRSDIFNMEKYGKNLRKIWHDSINDTVLKREFSDYNVYYAGSRVDSNGASQSDATDNQIEKMKSDILGYWAQHPKQVYQKSFKKWNIPRGSSEQIIAMKTSKGFHFEDCAEINDLKPDFAFGPTLVKVTADFINDSDGIKLKPNSINVKAI